MRTINITVKKTAHSGYLCKKCYKNNQKEQKAITIIHLHFSNTSDFENFVDNYDKDKTSFSTAYNNIAGIYLCRDHWEEMKKKLLDTNIDVQLEKDFLINYEQFKNGSRVV